MGGFGSGRWSWHRAKLDTDGLLKLDVRWLARESYLVPGMSGLHAVTWSRGEQPAGHIFIRYDASRPDELWLIYSIRRHDSEPWAPVREAVPLERTPCRYGGERVWFRCIGCLSRRAVLFSVGGRFRCRACHNLAYASTREDAIDRHRRRGRELRRRLGGEPGPFTIPWKPAGMHWQTYERMTAEMHTREMAALGAIGAETDALIARFDRQYGSPRFEWIATPSRVSP